jgi:hypothetical protein
MKSQLTYRAPADAEADADTEGDEGIDADGLVLGRTLPTALLSIVRVGV